MDNFNLMLPEELDRLAGNFLVSRRQGTNATGTQRDLLQGPPGRGYRPAATFRSITGQVYRPTTSVRLTAIELAASRNDAGEYFVDVPIVSEGTGSEFRAAPEPSTRSSASWGIPAPTTWPSWQAEMTKRVTASWPSVSAPASPTGSL